MALPAKEIVQLLSRLFVDVSVTLSLRSCEFISVSNKALAAHKRNARPNKFKASESRHSLHKESGIQPLDLHLSRIL